MKYLILKLLLGSIMLAFSHPTSAMLLQDVKKFRATQQNKFPNLSSADRLNEALSKVQKPSSLAAADFNFKPYKLKPAAKKASANLWTEMPFAKEPSLDFLNTQANSLTLWQSIKHTIKSDLGFEPQIPVYPKESELREILRDLGTACRLELYSLPAFIPLVSYVANKIISSSPTKIAFSTPTTHAQSSLSANNIYPAWVFPLCFIIAGPMLEELIFTYGIANFAGKTYGPPLAAILFALYHYDSETDLKIFALRALALGISEFIAARNFHATPRETFAPAFAHILHNGTLFSLAYFARKIRNS